MHDRVDPTCGWGGEHHTVEAVLDGEPVLGARTRNDVVRVDEPTPTCTVKMSWYEAGAGTVNVK